MTVGVRPEVPGYLRYQIGQILQSSESARLAGTIVYRGAPEKDSAALYKSETQDKAKSPI
jgi:hypothetical protein